MFEKIPQLNWHFKKIFWTLYEDVWQLDNFNNNLTRHIKTSYNVNNISGTSVLFNCPSALCQTDSESISRIPWNWRWIQIKINFFFYYKLCLSRVHNVHWGCHRWTSELQHILFICEEQFISFLQYHSVITQKLGFSLCRWNYPVIRLVMLHWNWMS